MCGGGHGRKVMCNIVLQYVQPLPMRQDNFQCKKEDFSLAKRWRKILKEEAVAQDQTNSSERPCGKYYYPILPG